MSHTRASNNSFQLNSKILITISNATTVNLVDCSLCVRMWTMCVRDISAICICEFRFCPNWIYSILSSQIWNYCICNSDHIALFSICMCVRDKFDLATNGAGIEACSGWNKSALVFSPANLLCYFSIAQASISRSGITWLTGTKYILLKLDPLPSS